MDYQANISAAFEAKKNRKSFIYTAIICALLLLIAFLITWPVSKTPPPVTEDLIEINLGNDLDGFGEEQPLIKGEMSPTNPSESNQQQQLAATQDDPADNVDDNNKDDDAAPIVKPEKATPKANNIAKQPVTSPIKNNNPAPVLKPVKPKEAIATYKGPGNEKGNNANEDNGYKYQGTTPDAKGDAGSPSGKPDSYGNSLGGRTGISVTRGVSPLNMGSLRFEDDFNENAKVYLDVRYDANGKYISATTAKGTTTTNANILGIAKRKAAQLKFPANDNGGVSTILLNFIVQK